MSLESSAVYKDSALLRLLATQRQKGEETVGLFSDIDHTYWKKGKETEMNELTAELARENIPTIVVTGNDYLAVLQRINAQELPYFHVIAGSVGTELWVLTESADGKKEYKKDLEFDNNLKSHAFVRVALAAQATHMIDTLKLEHPEWHFDFQLPEKEKELITNPDPTYQTFKISFYFYSLESDAEKVKNEVQIRFPDQRVVVCEEINYNALLSPDILEKKYCLDIIPVTKADTVKYLAKHAHIQKGIVAGDSGNDVDMLVNSETNFVAVLVGGAKSEALAAIHESRLQKSEESDFWVLKDRPNKFIYIEEGELLGPESIRHVLSLFKKMKFVMNQS